MEERHGRQVDPASPLPSGGRGAAPVVEEGGTRVDGEEVAGGGGGERHRPVGERGKRDKERKDVKQALKLYYLISYLLCYF